MKIKTITSLFQAPYLMFICAMLASILSLFEAVRAQSDDNNITINTGCTLQTFHWNIPENRDFNNSGTQNVVFNFSSQNLSFNTDSTLTVDGTLRVKNISCNTSNAKMILCPNAVIDLGGSTLVASSITLADGTEIISGNYSFNDGDNVSPVPSDLVDTIPSYKLSNSAKLIHGTLIIDSTNATALHLVESNEHITPAAGTINLNTDPGTIQSGYSTISDLLLLNNQKHPTYRILINKIN